MPNALDLLTGGAAQPAARPAARKRRESAGGRNALELLGDPVELSPDTIAETPPKPVESLPKALSIAAGTVARNPRAALEASIDPEFTQRLYPETERERYFAENPDLQVRSYDDPFQYVGSAFGAYGEPPIEFGRMPERAARSLLAIGPAMGHVGKELLTNLEPLLVEPMTRHGLGPVEGPEAGRMKRRDALRAYGRVGRDLALAIVRDVARLGEDPLGAVFERPFESVAALEGAGVAARAGGRVAQAGATTLRNRRLGIPPGKPAPPEIAAPAALGLRQEAMPGVTPEIPSGPIKVVPGAGAKNALELLGGEAKSFDQVFSEAWRNPDLTPEQAAIEAERVSGMTRPQGFDPAAEVSRQRFRALSEAGQGDIFAGLSEPAAAPGRSAAASAAPEVGPAPGANALGLLEGRPRAPATPTKPGMVNTSELQFHAPFQNRADLVAAGKFTDEGALQQFLRDAGGKYDEALGEQYPVIVWRDLKGEIGQKGATYVLDGHHRAMLAGNEWKLMEDGQYRAQGAVAREIHAVEFKGNYAQALEKAKDANRAGRPNTYPETAGRARALVESGLSERQVADRLRLSTGRVKEHVEFAHVDPELQRAYGANDQMRPFVRRMGRAVKRHPEYFDPERQRRILARADSGAIKSVAELDASLDTQMALLDRMKQSELFGQLGKGVSLEEIGEAVESVGRIIARQERAAGEITRGITKLYGKDESKWPRRKVAGLLADVKRHETTIAQLRRRYRPDDLWTRIERGLKAGRPVEQIITELRKEIIGEREAAAAVSPVRALMEREQIEARAPAPTKHARYIVNREGAEGGLYSVVDTDRHVTLRGGASGFATRGEAEAFARKLEAKPGPRAPRTAEEYIAAAEAAKPQFLDAIEAAAREVGAEFERARMEPFAVKGRESLEAKLQEGRIPSDVLRSTVIVKDLDQPVKIQAALERQGWKVITAENRMGPAAPGQRLQSGYRDYALKLFHPDHAGVAEVLLMGRKMHEAKEALGGHAAYEISRGIRRLGENVVRLPKDVQRVERIVRGFANRLYDRAFEADFPAAMRPSSTKASNSSRVTGAPKLSARSAALVKSLPGKVAAKPALASVSSSGEVAKGVERFTRETVARVEPLPQPTAPPQALRLVPKGGKPPRPPRRPPAPPATPPPPPAPLSRPGSLETGLQSVADFAKAMGDHLSVAGASRAAVKELRRQSPAFDMLASNIEARMEPGAQARRWARAARAHVNKADAEFYQARARMMEETARVFERSGMTKAEKQLFHRYVMGLDQLPANASKPVRTALDWWNSRSAQWQQDWVDAGMLTPETAWLRAWQPARIEAFGSKWEQRIQDLRRKELRRGKPGRADLVLRRRTQQLANTLYKDRSPFYFPMLWKVRPSDFLPTFGVKRFKPSSVTKQSRGTLFSEGSFVKDPALAARRHELETLKFRQAEQAISKVIQDDKIPKRLWDGGRIGPREELFSPDGFLRFYRQQIDFSKNVLKAVDSAGSVDDAIAVALRQAVDAGEFQTTATGIARAKVYVVPQSVMNELRARWSPVPRPIRLFFDRPMGWWKNMTLAARPAWVVNNVIGNTVFGTLQGVGPRDYLHALSEKYKARMPVEIDSGGFSTDAQLINLGRAADTGVGKLITYLEDAPGFRHVGMGLDWVKAKNAAIEDFFRRASYIRAATRVAREKHLQRTGDLFHRTFDQLAELDRLTPDEVAAAVKETNHWMNDYLTGLAPWERQWMRRILPFYSFLKHQVRLLATMPVKAPGRALMVQNLARVGEELERERDQKLPDFLQNKGLVDLGFEVPVRDRKMRAFLSTQGWNPLILGFSTSGEVRPTDVSDLVQGGLSMASWPIQYVGTAVSRRTTLGQAFREPATFERDGKFYRFEEDMEGYRGKVLRRHPDQGLVEVAAPFPEPVESYLGSYPQSQLAVRMMNPRSGFTAEPLSAETAKGATSATERTRLTEALRYFTGGSILLVDTSRGEVLPVRRSTLRALVRAKMSQEYEQQRAAP